MIKNRQSDLRAHRDLVHSDLSRDDFVRALKSFATIADSIPRQNRDAAFIDHLLKIQVSSAKNPAEAATIEAARQAHLAAHRSGHAKTTPTIIT